MSPIRILSLLLLVLVASFAGATDRRATDDHAHDLVETLVASDRWDDAEWVCRNALSKLPAGGLEHAKWTARLASVLASKNALGLFGGRPSELRSRIEPTIKAACEPIDSLLKSYPDLSARLFLIGEKLQIRRDVLRSAMVAASVAPADPELNDDLFREIARLLNDAEGLYRETSARLSERSEERSPAEGRAIAVDQYQRLLQELVVGRVSITVLQTELFEKDSDDYRAAANEAVQLAEQSLVLLADGTPAKLSTRALMTEALLRAGDLRSARLLIDDFGGAEISKGDPVWSALAARYALASGDVAAAKDLCNRFYRDVSADGPADQVLVMDFTKLECLLAETGNDSKISAWIESIGRRGGAFARRRAESIAIKSLRANGSGGQEENRPAMSPALVAAQGEDWLRRKDPKRASMLLREAALAERSGAKAFEYAGKSAAAALAAQDRRSAIEVLRRVAIRHPAQENAPDLVMQAALLGAKPFQPNDDPKGRFELIEETLKELSQTWPGADTAFKGNEWLCRMLKQTGRGEDAARVAVEFLMLRRKPDQVDATTDLVFDFVSSLDLETATSELGSLALTYRELASETESLSIPIARSAVWLLDRPMLQEFTNELQVADTDPRLVDRLLAFRTGRADAVPTEGASPALLERARWRLERDAMLDSSQQPVIGKVLLDWPSSDAPGQAWHRAKAAFWAQGDQHSIDQIKRLALEGKNQSESLRRALVVLRSSDSKVGNQLAIELSDRLAAMMKIGSESWYEEKLRAIRLLVQTGQKDEAIKRAKYILLIHPPKDAEIRKQLQQYSSPR